MSSTKIRPVMLGAAEARGAVHDGCRQSGAGGATGVASAWVAGLKACAAAVGAGCAAAGLVQADAGIESDAARPSRQRLAVRAIRRRPAIISRTL